MATPEQTQATDVTEYSPEAEAAYWAAEMAAAGALRALGWTEVMNEIDRDNSTSRELGFRTPDGTYVYVMFEWSTSAALEYTVKRNAEYKVQTTA